jgi:ribonuclease HI
MEIYTDGGCHGNPGPGGWAWVMCLAQGQREAKGYEAFTTNNRMELMAVIQVLETIRQEGLGTKDLKIHTDSQYVQKGISLWIKSWLRNGWRTASKQEVKNKDLWVRLHELDSLLKPKWIWVLGHAGNQLNERCDALVQEAIKNQG